MNADISPGTLILIVEDSPTQSMLLARTLEAAGYGVSSAPDGFAALEMLAADGPAPSLVITDINMPGMNGYELCAALREQERFRELPVLLLTSLANEEEIILGLESGADAFVSKPYAESKLLARVSDLLSGTESSGADDEVMLSGKPRVITASRKRILRYLISTYDSALQVNARLADSEAKLLELNSVLEETVEERVADLKAEVEKRKLAQNVVQVMNRLLEIANGNVNRELMLGDFQAHVAAFSGCPTVELRVRTGRDSPEPDGAPEGPSARAGTEARVAVRLGEDSFGYILVVAEAGKEVPPETVQVLEAASSQLAAALRRMEADDMLRESEERYRSFFDEDLSGALILTPDGTITNCNPAFMRIFGLADAATSIGSSALFMYREPREWESFAAAVRRDGNAPAMEAEYRRMDGAPVFAIGSAIGEFDAAGELAEIRQYLVDITERKGLEQQLFQAQKMEAIGRLAGGVAHDFNNVLQVIQGFAEHLIAKTPEDDPRSAWLKQIHKAGLKAGALVQNLLAFSRKQAHDNVILDLNAVLEDAAPMIRQLTGDAVSLKLEPFLGLGEVDADRNQMDQVLLNLAANARDAMPDGGVLTCSTSNTELEAGAKGLGPEAVKPGPYVRLSVRDTGTGMSPEAMAHLFEPFFTTKPIGKGTGLGLATVYGVIKQAGGFVSCDSAPGEGTEIAIYLPRTDRSAK